MTWQPISTAPKDGRAILAYRMEDWGPVMTTIRWEIDHDNGGEWELCKSGAYAVYTDWEPTHWQPLPEPPEGLR